MAATADDPFVMYYVVRTGVAFTLGQAMEAAGAAAVDCTRSERSPLLEALRPFTDAPRPKEAPPPLPDGTATMVYAIRPGVMRTAGKAMAQAGHAALMCVERFAGEGEYEQRFDAWRESGRRGELIAVSDEDWERLKRDPEAVVVSDAGHTQVVPGTETVIALVPATTTRASRPA